MTYMITRDGQQYGPYSLGDLQRYVASGDVLLTDLAISEGMSEPLPVAQIIGSIPVPTPVSPISMASSAVIYPDPPNLAWGLVLLFDIITFGIFAAAWGLVLAIWAKKVVPSSKSVIYYVINCGLLFLIFFASMVASMEHTSSPFTGILQLLSFGFGIAAKFSLKNTLEEHYNTNEPMGLLLGGVMTFFFSSIYFQWHLNDIVRRKKLDSFATVAV